MKITTNRPPAPFTPVSLTLTFESQAELDAMGKLFNVDFISSAFAKLAGVDNDLWKTFENLGADINFAHEAYAPFMRNHSGFRIMARAPGL